MFLTILLLCSRNKIFSVVILVMVIDESAAKKNRTQIGNNQAESLIRRFLRQNRWLFQCLETWGVEAVITRKRALKR